eukprot:3815024-Pleurochrysis_carterae.AAC.1
MAVVIVETSETKTTRFAIRLQGGWCCAQATARPARGESESDASDGRSTEAKSVRAGSRARGPGTCCELPTEPQEPVRAG